LRRCLARWSAAGLLAKIHALLVGMRRGHPDLILDSGSVHAKRGGDLTGPNPTDRGERGTKYWASPALVDTFGKLREEREGVEWARNGVILRMSSRRRRSPCW
jgi:hypothetical protein